MPTYPLNRLVAKIAGKLPLRTVLIVPFVLQTVSAVGLVGYLSFKNSQSAVEYLAHQLIQQVGERISDRLTAYLQTPQDVVAANRIGLQQGMLNLTFLEKLHFSPSGQAFTIDRSGNLVATSTLETLVVKSPKGPPTPLLAVNSQDTRTRDIARQLANKFGNFRTLQTTEQLTLGSNRSRHFVRVTPYRGYGWDLLIVVVLPESDFMPQIEANNRNTGLLCAGTLALAIALGLFTARWIAKPILRLNTAVQNIANGEWDKTVEIERFDEVRELANSFNTMTAQLQQSFAEQKSLNEALAHSENQLKQFIEAVPVAVTVHDLTGKITYANQTSRQLIGFEILPEAEFEQLTQIYQVYRAGTEQLYPIENMPVIRSIKGEKARADDMEIRWSDRRVSIEVYSTPLFDDSGQNMGAIAAFMDITDRKQTEKTLANYNRTLEAEVTARTTALADTNKQLQREITERELVEGKLGSSTQQVNTIFESITDVVLIIDDLERLQIIPTKATGLYTSDVNQFYLIVLKMFHHGSKEIWVAKVREALATQQTVDFDYSLQINNQEVWFSAKISPLPNGSVVWVARDITDRKQIEEKLQWSEKRLDTIVTNISDGITIVDRQGKISFANPAAAELFNQPASELIGFHWGIPTQDTSEISLIDADGKIRTAEINSTPTQWLGELAYIVALRDITDRKLAESTLRESAQREQAISRAIERMHQSLDIATIFNTTTAELRPTLKCDRVVIYRFNPDWSGEFVAESVGPGWTPLIPEQLPEKMGERNLQNNLVEDARCIVKTLEGSPRLVRDTYIQETKGGAYSQGAIYRMTEDIYNAGFTPCYLELLERFQARAYLIVPIFCGNQMWGLLASYQNSQPRAWRESEINIALQISTQLGIALQQAQLLKATQQQAVQLQQAALAAEAANRAKSTFLANMSHELRTPLNAILGFSQLMQHSTNLNPQEQENIRIINRSGEHLLTLINQILDLAKIEVGRITLNLTDFELRSLLNELEEMFQLQAREQQLSLIVDCADSLPAYVRTDVVKLRQVLINLLSNAVKFTKEGGISLKVKQQTTSPKSQESTNNSQQINISFEVEDTGFGIDPDELGKLFEPFVQTKTGEASQQGSGLGLAISQQFVNLMGGSITVNSRVGCGSTFTFEIPVSAVDVAAIQPKQPLRQVIALEPNQPCYRILIVDDRQDNRQLLLKLLNRFEFELAEASNGIEAIEMWSSFEPHLIFMDLRMPVMDGYEATKQIKANTKGQATAIVAVTGSNVDAAGTVILSSGCDDLIRKPFREAEIFDTIHNHLGVRYIYDRTQSVSESTQIETLTPEAFADLPAAWVASLEKATIQCDLELILSHIEQIRDRNDSLAKALLAFANQFQFNQILALIQPQIK